MTVFEGTGVCRGIAIGKIAVYKRTRIRVERKAVTDTEAEINRYENAKRKAVEKLREVYEAAVKEVGEENAQIFDIHMMLIDDEDYNDAVIGMIRNQYVNAQYAVKITGENFARMFSDMDDSYMQARAVDIMDISERIIAGFSETGSEASEQDESVIICADDLAPSETVSLDKKKILAFATAGGSAYSHTAILARSMNIPAVIGLGKDFLSSIKDGDTAITDGNNGVFILSPDEKTVAEYEEKKQRETERLELLKRLKGKENITLDGTRIKLFANIGNAEDIGDVIVNDADGIGLFRSEFLYLGRSGFPTEEEQFSVYKRVLESMGSKKVIIRTLDIGADKQADYFAIPKEENPALGMRAVRICITRPEIIRTQLRALYRASPFGNLGIMFPMITSLWELREILEIANSVKKELRNENIAVSYSVETGIMIETPAAAIISDKLAPLVDFFSIGTNDLTQYTLACDRQNPAVYSFTDDHHEAVLRLIEATVKNAHANGIWAGICGELAADTSLTEYFLRLGVDELSVSPPLVLPLREKIRSTDLKGKGKQA